MIVRGDLVADTDSASPTTSDQALAEGDLHTALAGLGDAIAAIYRGPRRAINFLLTGWLAGGHVLLEDIPGVGKTTLARALAAISGGQFARLQCTPDLMPADVTGVGIYDEQQQAFVFHPGPVFCDVLLADELNRTPPRTQSALLEAMSEGQVTVDGTSHPLPEGFFCVATQNPLDNVGTYPLPDSQKDRFLLGFSLGYPERDSEAALLAADGAEGDLARSQPAMTAERATALRASVRRVMVSSAVRGYLLDIVDATRTNPQLAAGASPRAAIGLQRAAQAWALLAGRDFVVPDDVQQLATPCLSHRVAARAGHAADAIIDGLVEAIPVPR